MSVSAFPHGACAAAEEAGGLSVIPNTNGDDNFRLNANCYAGIQWQNDGDEAEYTNSAGLNVIGTWLKAGTPAEVWVACAVTSGSWNSLNPGTSLLQLSTTRSFRIVRTTNGTHSVTCVFNFYDAASGGNLIATTGSITFNAERGSA